MYAVKAICRTITEQTCILCSFCTCRLQVRVAYLVPVYTASIGSFFYLLRYKMLYYKGLASKFLLVMFL